MNIKFVTANSSGLILNFFFYFVFALCVLEMLALIKTVAQLCKPARSTVPQGKPAGPERLTNGVLGHRA